MHVPWRPFLFRGLSTRESTPVAGEDDDEIVGGDVAGDGDVGQLVEHRTDTPPTKVRFPGAARDFSPRVNFKCRLTSRVRTPSRVQSHTLTFVRTLKIP